MIIELKHALCSILDQEFVLYLRRVSMSRSKTGAGPGHIKVGTGQNGLFSIFFSHDPRPGQDRGT